MGVSGWPNRGNPHGGRLVGGEVSISRNVYDAEHPFNLLTYINIISNDHRLQVHSPESRGGLWSCGHVRSQANGKH